MTDSSNSASFSHSNFEVALEHTTHVQSPMSLSFNGEWNVTPQRHFGLIQELVSPSWPFHSDA